MARGAPRAAVRLRRQRDGGRGGVGLLARDGGPARRVAVAGAALELAASAVVERRDRLSARAYRTGRAGAALRVARAATAAGGLAAAAGR
ncbi:hypothetical protein ACFQV8_24275 [Pseudonocardia benzenivorans]